MQHHLRWRSACDAVESEEGALENSVRSVAGLTQSESEAIRMHAQSAEAMQPLRDEEATRAAVLHRLNVERETLEREEERARARKQELEDRLTQLEGDQQREHDRESEASQALERLQAEQKQLSQAPDASQAAATARTAMEARADELRDAENELSGLTGRMAELRAQRQQLSATVAHERERITRLEAQSIALDEKLKILEAEQGGDAGGSELRSNISALSSSASELETRVIDAEAVLNAARDKEHEAREAAADAKLHAQELETEAQTLVKLLKPAEDLQWAPIVGKVRVEPGYELALGAALGDDLDASDEPLAPAHWNTTSSAVSDPDLPAGAQPLGQFVKAPAALSRRLAQIGIVSSSEGNALQGQLKPGQRLVSKSGDLWRWDGYSAAAAAPTAAAKRLSERNRLDELTAQAEAARSVAIKAEALYASLSEDVSAAQTLVSDTTSAWRKTQNDLGQARDALAAIEHTAQASSKELGAQAEARSRTQEALGEAREALATSKRVLEALESETALNGALETQQSAVETARAAYSDARAAHDTLAREQQILQDRINTVSSEISQWAARHESSEKQIETLKQRIGETRTETEEFTDLPMQVEERRTRLMDEISRAEKERRDAADALAEADTGLREHEKAMREAQASLAEAREGRARTEAQLEAARERRSEQARMITEQLECAPEECLAIADLQEEEAIPGLPEIDARIAALKADRERLGGVNLGADEMLEEISSEIEGMSTEQLDLEAAIAELRQGISKLNRDGRKRLLEAFDEVNVHFQGLFKTLFGGGEAELQLIDGDDPLEAGLEILARPPGKKTQVLTLLSGGEKALTAMALIFAVFRTNPSPICVLDEVDAPLDDTNVERFCKMMEEMSNSTDTRFLIITHHPMTMASMDRLFGITMAERGVSQLVSVDLVAAEQFRDTG